MQLFRFIAPGVFNLVRIFMTLFGAIFTIVGLGVLAFLWVVPAGNAGPFADLPLPMRLFASLVGFGFVAFSIIWMIVLWSMNPGQGTMSRFRQMQNLQDAPEPIRRHSTPIACPNCGAKFVPDNSAGHKHSVCSFCGAALPH